MAIRFTWYVPTCCQAGLLNKTNIKQHGHHFYILRTYQAPVGWGAYNPFTDAYPPGLAPESASSSRADTPYDLSRAQLRDTVYIPSRGHAILRFRADNPGIWLFHCHIIWHQASGMAMLLQI